ncbi:MAG TPA: ACP phosphodiesterase [Fontimonas sp.]
MNFLAHLLVARRTQTSEAGAILGDIVRGADLSAYPADIQRGIRIHRRIDALTDRHPLLQIRRQDFAPESRRYAGIVLDLASDFALAQDWTLYCDETLPAFCARSGAAVAAGAPWFEHAGGRPPQAAGFAELLSSYATVEGIERALRRTSTRLSQPAALLQAGNGWPAQAQALRAALPQVLDDLIAGIDDLLKPAA